MRNVAVVLLIVAVAATGCTSNDLIVPAPTVPATPASSTEPSPTASISIAVQSPSPSPVPTNPTPTAPAAAATPLTGWTVLATSDTADASWSPDGKWLLVWDARTNGSPSDDHVYLYDAAGTLVRDLPGETATWLNARSFVLFGEEVTQMGSVGSDALTRVDDLRLPLNSSAQSNGHGAIAFLGWTADLSERYRVWTANGLTPWIPGDPAAWSRDGRLLAVWHEVATGPGAGGDITGWLEVLRWPGLSRLAEVRGETIDIRGWSAVAFDPSGRFLAFHTDRPPRNRVLDLKTGTNVELDASQSGSFAWNAQGQLMVASDGGSVTTFGSDGHQVSVQNDLGDSVTSSLDGSTVAAWFSDSGTTIDLLRARAMTVVPLPGQLWSLPLPSPDGTRLAIDAQGADGTSVFLRQAP